MTKIITVSVTTDDKKDNSATSVLIEEDRGAGPVRVDGKDIVTNKDKDVQFRLKPGQSLTIEAYAKEAVAYDRDQGAAYTPHTQIGENAHTRADSAVVDAHARAEADKAKVPPQKASPNPPTDASKNAGVNVAKPQAQNPNPGLRSSKDV